MEIINEGAIKTNSLPRAVAYLERNGVEVDMSTAKGPAGGPIVTVTVYLKDEISELSIEAVKAAKEIDGWRCFKASTEIIEPEHGICPLCGAYGRHCVDRNTGIDYIWCLSAVLRGKHFSSRQCRRKAETSNKNWLRLCLQCDIIYIIIIKNRGDNYYGEKRKSSHQNRSGNKK